MASDDDTDKRFVDLIHAEFGEDVSPAPSLEPEPSPEPSPAPFSFSEAMERADPEPIEPWERFSPPIPGPIGHPRPRAIVGLTTVLASVLLGVAGLMNAVPRSVSMIGAPLLLGIGLLLLLFSLPKHSADDDYDDGAQL